MMTMKTTKAQEGSKDTVKEVSAFELAKEDMIAKRKLNVWYPFQNMNGGTGGQNVLTGDVCG